MNQSFTLFNVARRYFTTLALIINGMFATAQPSVQWQKTYGGTGNEGIQSLRQTADSGYILACYTTSNDSDVSGNHGGGDAWIVKTNANGVIQWRKTLGGTNYDYPIMISETNNGFLLTGQTNSNNGTIATANHGAGDAWVLKLDDTGGTVWQKVLGGSSWDFGNSITPTSDHGCIMTGGTYSSDGDVSGLHGAGDVWVVKFDSSGNIQWNKTYGGTDDDWGFTIKQTFEGGYIVAASTASNNGDVTSNHGSQDAWIIKLNDTGAISWQKTYGGSNFEQALPIVQTSDSGYIFSGETYSNDGDISANHGGWDYWLVKINATGTLVWEKTYGGTNDDLPTYMQQTGDGGFILGGFTASNSGDVTGNHGPDDMWVVKTNDTGYMQWEKCFGGTGNDTANCIIQTFDGGYAIAGATTSHNGDITQNRGGEDCWLVKLNATTGVPTIKNNADDIKVYPVVSDGMVYIELPEARKQAQIRLMNLDGQALPVQELSGGLTHSLQLSNIPPAMYIIQVIDKDRINSFRIIYHP